MFCHLLWKTMRNHYRPWIMQRYVQIWSFNDSVNRNRWNQSFTIVGIHTLIHMIGRWSYIHTNRPSNNPEEEIVNNKGPTAIKRDVKKRSFNDRNRGRYNDRSLYKTDMQSGHPTFRKRSIYKRSDNNYAPQEWSYHVLFMVRHPRSS